MTPDEQLEQRDKLMRLVGNLESIVQSVEKLSLPHDMKHAIDLLSIAQSALEKAYIKLWEDAGSVRP